jgi:hypothetical protein
MDVTALSNFAKKLTLSDPVNSQLPFVRMAGGGLPSERELTMVYPQHCKAGANSHEISTCKIKEFNPPEMSTYEKKLPPVAGRTADVFVCGQRPLTSIRTRKISAA